MPAPATRTWKFFGDVFSDSPSIDVTITFNGVVIHDGEIPADFSSHDYHNRWDEVMPLDAEHKLLCQTELPYSTTGLIPLNIKVNSAGVLNYAWAICNYTSVTWADIDVSIDFTSSCSPKIDNKRNIRINDDIIDVAPLGWSYHITEESQFQCDIFMDPEFSSWIPGWFGASLTEPWKRKF